MGGYLFIRDSEEEYENSVAAKKELLFIEGASHGFTPCRNCSADPDAYANSVRNLFDQVKNWVDATMR